MAIWLLGFSSVLGQRHSQNYYQGRARSHFLQPTHEQKRLNAYFSCKDLNECGSIGPIDDYGGLFYQFGKMKQNVVLWYDKC